MPKQKAPKGATSADNISDPRFSNFTTDPRFRLPSKKQTRTKIDKRFSRMLKEEDFSNTAKVDRYGRKLSGEGKNKALERLYVPDESESESEGGKQEVEVEEDEVVEKELKRAENYDAARGGGFSSSEDEDEEDEEEGGVEIEEAAFPDMQAEQAGVEMGEVSKRIAVVNLDWDNIRSTDLMAVFSSFAKGGKIHKISIYPSEFGKERMEREELEGPPPEIFSRKQDSDEDEEESDPDSEDSDADEKIKKELQATDEGKDFDDSALRQYQLERLRYYYAVLICSDTSTAQSIYEAVDGTEYLSSANFFDLRFIPDDVTFDDKPRDECKEIPIDYHPTEFVTDALQHSKVKLTWDMDPEESSRKDAIKRAFSGSRAEIGENDLRAYLGSDSDSEPSQAEAENEEPKLSKKELARQKMREALGLTSEPSLPSKSKKEKGPVGDMQITFTAGLSTTSTSKGVFENEPIIEETTAEAYIRKEKERKARRKEKARAKREGRDPSAEPEDVAGEDLGFDDPFFATSEEIKEKAAKSQRKAERLAKREAKAEAATKSASERAALSLLMEDEIDGSVAEEGGVKVEHFDYNEIARVEKKRKKKGKGKDGEGESKRGGLQETFKMNAGDERFAGRLFEDYEYTIDPSNAKFEGTEGMKRVLEEGRRKRGREVEGEEVDERARKKGGGDGGKGGLKGLVESVRKKSKR